MEDIDWGPSFGPGFWTFAICFALLTQMKYLLWAGQIPAGDGSIHLGSAIWDFDKHLSVMVALARDGLPAGHPFYRGLPLVYYTGFYMVPAALAALLPAAMIQLTTAQFVFSSIIYITILAYLIRRLVPASPLWRGFGLFAALVGLTPGWYIFGFDTLVPGIPWLRWLWGSANHPHPMLLIYEWLPQHLLAVGYSLLCFVALPSYSRERGSSIVCWIIFTAFLCSASIMVGVIYGLTWMIATTGSLLLNVRRTNSLPSRDFLLTVLVQPMAAGLIALPHYSSLLTTIFTGSTGDGGMFTLAEHPNHHLGFLVFTCGVGLIGFVLYPVPSLRQAELARVFLFAALTLLMALSIGPYSELLPKSLLVAQGVLPVLTITVAIRAWLRHRALGLALSALVALNALLSLADGYRICRYHYMPAYTRVSRDVVELLSWLSHHIPLNGTVTMLDGRRADWCYLAARGSEINFERMNSAKWTDAARLPDYFRRHPSNLQSAAASDCVLLPFVPLNQFFISRPVRLLEENRLLLKALGFEPILENSAGLIARGPAAPTNRIQIGAGESGRSVLMALARLGCLSGTLPDALTENLAEGSEVLDWLLENRQDHPDVGVWDANRLAFVAMPNLRSIAVSVDAPGFAQEPAGQAVHDTESLIAAMTAHKHLLTYSGMPPFSQWLEAAGARAAARSGSLVVFETDSRTVPALRAASQPWAEQCLDAVRRINEFLHCHDTDRQIALLREYLGTYPQSAIARKTLAASLITRMSGMQQDDPAMLALLEELGTLRPRSVPAYTRRRVLFTELPSARQLVNAGRWAEAISRLRMCVALVPEEAEAHYLAAFAAQNNTEAFEEARMHYQHALELGFDPFWVHLNRGLLLTRRGEFDEARADLEAAYRINPAHPGLAEALERARLRAESARRAAERARIEPQLAQARRHLEQGEPDAGRALLRQCLDVSPECAEAHYLLGFSLHTSHRDDAEALVHYDDALRYGFHEFWVRFNRAGLLERLGCIREARADYLRAFELNPGHPGLTEALSRTQAALDKLRLAAESSARLPAMARGREAVRQGNWPAVESAMREVLAHAPDAAEAHYLLAFALHARHDRAAEALRHYDSALGCGFDEFWVRFNRGSLLADLGREVEARADLNRAAELQPKHPGPPARLSRMAQTRPDRG